MYESSMERKETDENVSLILMIIHQVKLMQNRLKKLEYDEEKAKREILMLKKQTWQMI